MSAKVKFTRQQVEDMWHKLPRQVRKHYPSATAVWTRLVEFYGTNFEGDVVIWASTYQHLVTPEKEPVPAEWGEEGY